VVTLTQTRTRMHTHRQTKTNTSTRNDEQPYGDGGVMVTLWFEDGR